MAAIPDVLNLYGPKLSELDWQPAGGGFSGAAVFAGSQPGAATPLLALKRWPAGVARDRIARSHADQTQIRAVLDCVPGLVADRHGGTISGVDNHYWDLSDWRPGASVHRLSPRQLGAAAEVIATLHRVQWPAQSFLPQNRLADRIAHVNESVAGCKGLAFEGLADPLRGQCRELQGQLQPVRERAPVSPDRNCVLPIHGDLHRGHLFFSGDAVTGLIDFASVKIDHPAVDVARYFGEAAADELSVAVSEYRTAGGDPGVTVELVDFLSAAILRGAAAHWLLRFAAGDIPAEQLPAAAERLAALRQRLRARP